MPFMLFSSEDVARESGVRLAIVCDELRSLKGRKVFIGTNNGSPMSADLSYHSGGYEALYHSGEGDFLLLVPPTGNTITLDGQEIEMKCVELDTVTELPEWMYHVIQETLISGEYPWLW